MGGGAMRAAAKLTGVTVATGSLRGITAEHLPISSTKRGAFSVRAAATATSSAEEVKLVSSQSQNSCSEIDDWVLTGGEEKVIVAAGEPMPRVVFGGAPTLQEAKEATSELAHTFEKAYLSARDSIGYGNSVVGMHDLGSNSQVECAKVCGISDIMAPALSSPAVKAFRLLHESPAAQNVVASIACDPNVWTAVLQNPELQDFLNSQKTSLGLSEAVTDADHSEMLSAKSMEDSSSNAKSKKSNVFVDFVQKVKGKLDDMMNYLSDIVQSIFGGQGSNVSANDENLMGASFLGLAVMAILVILLKRG